MVRFAPCSPRPGSSLQLQSQLTHGMSCFTTVRKRRSYPTAVDTLPHGLVVIAHSSNELHTGATAQTELLVSRSTWLLTCCWWILSVSWCGRYCEAARRTVDLEPGPHGRRRKHRARFQAFTHMTPFSSTSSPMFSTCGGLPHVLVSKVGGSCGGAHSSWVVTCFTCDTEAKQCMTSTYDHVGCYHKQN